MKVLLIVCLVNLWTLTWSCSSSADCSKLHVCFAGTIYILGKRATGTGLTGDCTLLKTEGQSCWVTGGSITSRPDHVIRHNLPCELGLYCKGIGLSIVPFGEAGSCTALGQ
ncbi:uncharacterized protein LOC121367837 [Gigantopelta aegis]|uniref:uncharacterized protein LOC121367837 n=1 Tax=Gigantopelta aegis TaxID=1735272 RepID=UPI001B88DE69|nr:uncharacterized protein LOC121367837 [Gigantopelta aegis]